MNTVALALLFCCAVAAFTLPRSKALLPLLVVVFAVPISESIALGVVNLQAVRLLIGFLVVRSIVRAERPAGGGDRLDAFMLLWAAVALATAGFHDDPAATVVHRGGLVYNALGCYYLVRVYCGTPDDLLRSLRMLAGLLLLLTPFMVLESLAGINLFGALGRLDQVVRGDSLRAQGAFGNSILAGTVGAASIPLMAALWPYSRRLSAIGLVACVAIVATSRSSGPIASALLALLALSAWGARSKAPALKWLFLGGYVLLEIVMSAPAYYALARIDLTGSSTGWHRAEVIDAAIKHFGEWAAYGTDVTRHWMAYGIQSSKTHIDITNHYVLLGVYGGVGLMLLFVASIARSFALWQRTIVHGEGDRQTWLAWCMGSSLFVHAATLMTTAYFDQSIFLLYFAIASPLAFRSPAAREFDAVSGHREACEAGVPAASA